MCERVPFVWPNPQSPMTVVRDLTVLRRKGQGESALPLRLVGIKLIVLIPEVLYIVPVDVCEGADQYVELTPGVILSRNLKLSEKVYGDRPTEPIDECFVSFRDIFRARRGLRHADERYQTRENPANDKLLSELDKLMRTSWELHRVDEQGRMEYVAQAVKAAQNYGRPEDTHKVEAQARTMQAGVLHDKTGRFNPGRLPLIVFAGERKIGERIQAVRGIGRRMGFRETVLEYYLDQLREVCRDVSRSQAHRLRTTWLATGPERTPKKVKKEARRLEEASARLRLVVVRPFSRSFNRCADDLMEAGHLLCQSAEQRDEALVISAKQKISQVYRATIMLDARWRLEEVLLQIGILRDREGELTSSRRRVWRDELYNVHTLLCRVDPLTRMKLDADFERQVLKHVTAKIYLTLQHLKRSSAEGGVDLEVVESELKLACEPL